VTRRDLLTLAPLALLAGCVSWPKPGGPPDSTFPVEDEPTIAVGPCVQSSEGALCRNPAHWAASAPAETLEIDGHQVERWRFVDRDGVPCSVLRVRRR
jgi:hypothetical protein